MPRFHKDEVSKLEDIEALLVTAYDLAARFRNARLVEASGSIQKALVELRSAKTDMITEWRAIDNPPSD